MVFDGSVDAKTGVSLKGNMYWLASSETEFLLSFDFIGERFKRFCLPSLPPISNLGKNVLSVVRDEQFSVLYQNFRYIKNGHVDDDQ